MLGLTAHLISVLLIPEALTVLAPGVLMVWNEEMLVHAFASDVCGHLT